MNQEYIAIQPEYVKKFQCDGSACNAMCCQKWRIDIDKQTFKKYKKIPDKNLRQKILSGIKRNKKTDTYEIKLNQDKKCPHLCDDHLCFIQRNVGESYLSNVCRTYPRLTQKINGYLEQSLVLTCPIAAKLILLNETPMRFEQVNITRPTSLPFDNDFDTQQLAMTNPLFNYSTFPPIKMG